jgi:hypothetical protein
MRSIYKLNYKPVKTKKIIQTEQLIQHRKIQGVSKIHGITSGMSSSYVPVYNKNGLYQHRSGNA